jgi:hypothetical protein
MAENKKLERKKAIQEYIKTGDLLMLQKTLGHKKLRSSLAYLEVHSDV